MKPSDNICLEIRGLYPSMHKVERIIADYILKSHNDVINMTVAQIGRKINVADSSIIRFCKSLGFSGFSEFKLQLAKGFIEPEKLIFENIEKGDHNHTVLKKVFGSNIKTLQNTLKMIQQESFNQAVDALLNADKIIFYGVGSSATIVDDFYYRFMRIGLPVEGIKDPHIAMISASMLSENSLAIGISHTGKTQTTVNTLKMAKTKNAQTMCVTSFFKTPLTEVSDISLVISSSEGTIMNEAISSRIAHITLLDSLYACVSLIKSKEVLPRIQNMNHILNDLRY